jgi:acetyl esterase
VPPVTRRPLPTLPSRLVPHFLALILAGLNACAGLPGGRAPERPTVVPYRVVGADTLSAHLFAARGSEPTPRAAVILLHGGGWSDGSPEWVYAAAREFAKAGLVAIALEYRLADSTHTPIDALEDVCAGIVWARARADSLGFARERVAGYGVSAGGHLAAATVTVGCPFAALNRGFDALALLSPAVDVERDAHFGRLLQGRATATALSPIAQATTSMPPTIIVQGDRDTLTPLAGAQRFCLNITMTRGQCELRVYSELGHLLTRNLSEQESRFDPDPVARADGLARQIAFIRQVWQ